MDEKRFSRMGTVLMGIVVMLVVAVGAFVLQKQKNPLPGKSVQETRTMVQESTIPQELNTEKIDKEKIKQTADPLSEAVSRITKKPFGIFVTPQDSPVQLERFSGYHNAVDLEVFSDEIDVDVPVKAFCGGKLLQKRTASGYGGIAIQSCVLEGQVVTVIYGHIRLSSLRVDVGDEILPGDFLAYLGNAYSSETDGERKHLHLGIHKGADVDIAGYVNEKSKLSEWIDPLVYF